MFERRSVGFCSQGSVRLQHVSLMRGVAEEGVHYPERRVDLFPRLVGQKADNVGAVRWSDTFCYNLTKPFFMLMRVGSCLREGMRIFRISDALPDESKA